MVTLKLPPGSTLVSDQGVFHTKDKERPFACGYCGLNYKRKKHVYRHIMLKHDEKDVTSHSHMKTQTGGKPFKCSLCDRQFHVEIDFLNHLITHKETRKLLLGYAHGPEESRIKAPVQLAPSQCIRQFNQDNSKTQEKTLMFASSNCTALTEKLPDNTGLKDTNCCSSDEVVGEVLRSSSHRATNDHGSCDEVVGGVSRPSSRRATNDHGTSSSLRGHVESMDTLKLPPGSTLVSDRGVFRTKDKERPFACGYCGMNYKTKKHVCRHIMVKHDEKRVTIYLQEKSFTCDQCGMRFRLQSDLCYHKCMHSEERVFPCTICNKSYASKRELFRHSKVHKKEECREGVICNIFRKEFSDHYNLKEHMKTHTGGKLFKCSLCAKHFLVEIDLQHHMISHNKNGKLLPGDAHDPEESTINVPDQDAPNQSIKQFNLDNSKTQEKTIVFSTNNCTALTQQLPDNTGLLESNCHTFQLEDRQVQVEPNLTKASSRLATANPYSPLISTNGKLMDAHVQFDNSYDRVVSESAEEVDESQSLNDTTTKFNQSQGEGYSSNSVTGKRISLADGIAYEVSCSESSQCSTMTQALQQSDQLEVFTDHPSSRHSVNDPGTSSSFFGHVESMVSSKLPSGSTVVSDLGVFFIEDKEMPFMCSYCGKDYLTKKAVYAHITQHHEEKVGFSCDYCGKRFGDQYHLSRHVTIHMRKKTFSCDQCGMRFRLKDELRRHKFTHTEERLFPWKICNKSYTSKGDLFSHSTVHKDEECREGVICNVWKEEFSDQCILSSNNCTTGLMECNFHLQDCQIQTKPILDTAPSGLATTDPDSTLRCTNTCSLLVSALNVSSENVCNKVVSESEVAIVEEPRTSSTMKAKPSQSQCKGYPTKAMNGKRISIASGIVYEDEVSSPETAEEVPAPSSRQADTNLGIMSSPESSRCSTTPQTLLSSNYSETDEEVPAPSSRQANNNNGTSSSHFRHVESVVSSKVPPGSTLVSDRGVYRIKDKENPFACAFCGKVYKRKNAVYAHIRYQHDEKRYSCEFCGRSYGEQFHLVLHMRIHTQENPFTCDQCGMCFRWQNSLRQHKFTHTAVRAFVCSVCNKSYKCKEHLMKHSKIHKKEECRGVICNICNRKFLRSSDLEMHMTVHTGEKPFKCSLCAKQFRMKMQLEKHLNTHSGLRKTCSVCGKTVAANSMRQHMKMHTGMVKEGLVKRLRRNL